MKLAVKISLLLIAVSLISILIFGFVSYDNIKTALEEEVTGHLVATNLLKGAEIERWLKDSENMIELLAKNPDFKDKLLVEKLSHNSGDAGHIAVHEDMVKEILQPGIAEGSFFELFILNPENGLVLLSTDKKQEGKFQNDQPYFINGKKQTFIQNVYYSMTLRQPAMSVGTPVKDLQGNTIAVLVGRLNLAELSGIITIQSGHNKTEDTYLVNKFNFFITEPKYGKNFALQKAVYTEGIVAALEQNSNTGLYNNYVKTPVIGDYQWMPQLELCLVTEISQEEAFAPLAVLGQKILYLGIGVIFFASALGWLLSITITKPVKQLIDGTIKIGSGDLDYKLNRSGKDEISMLSAAFDQMTKKLKESLVSRDKLTAEISERIKLEEILKRSNAELENFAYVASHDLQEPLRMVASYTALLERRYKDKLDSDANEFIFYAVDGAKRMQMLIEDLLAYSRIATVIKPLEIIDMESVLKDSIRNLQVSISESKARITHDKLPMVMGDELRLVQVLQNLISNALKFKGKEPPIIHISVVKDEAFWVFSVKDNGIGIETQYFDKVFLIFQRLQGSEYRGTGIGLAIAKKIVESYGGRIWVESEPENGSTFYFTLPVMSGKEV